MRIETNLKKMNKKHAKKIELIAKELDSTILSKGQSNSNERNKKAKPN